jgi:signal transduction histidine kinase
MLLIPVAIAYIIIGIASYYSSFHEAEEIYDAHLTHLAKVLRALTRHEVKEGDVTEKRIDISENFDLHTYEKNYAYRVWLGNKMILQSSNSLDFGTVTVLDGFSERKISKHLWRFFVLRDKSITVEVAERSEIRVDLIHHILAGIFLPQILIIPSLALIIWIGVVRGIRPINNLSDLIRRRDPNNLEPIQTESIPKEVAPVVESINDLMLRVSEVLDHEKKFSNYAAHELRTPLAALKTQIQVAVRTRDEKKSREMFMEMLPAIDRMQHLVDQLLTFVRIKSNDNNQDQIDLGKLCQSILTDMVPDAVKTCRELSSDVDSGAFVHGEADMLSTLIRNLVGNAMKYTKPAGHIYVTVRKDSDKVLLMVADDGIGISEKEMNNIFDSFYRVTGTHANGCGLGLAIVKWIAEMHHAEVGMEPGLNGQGVSFVIRFTKKAYA